jgi:hypothetical protein
MPSIFTAPSQEQIATEEEIIDAEFREIVARNESPTQADHSGLLTLFNNWSQQ